MADYTGSRRRDRVSRGEVCPGTGLARHCVKFFLIGC